MASFVGVLGRSQAPLAFALWSQEGFETSRFTPRLLVIVSCWTEGKAGSAKPHLYCFPWVHVVHTKVRFEGLGSIQPMTYG